jgi:hypothetical protein
VWASSLGLLHLLEVRPVYVGVGGYEVLAPYEAGASCVVRYRAGGRVARAAALEVSVVAG